MLLEKSQIRDFFYGVFLKYNFKNKEKYWNYILKGL